MSIVCITQKSSLGLWMLNHLKKFIIFRLMQIVNGFMSIHLAGTFIINILLGCFWLYVLLWELDFYQNDFYGLVMLVFWFVIAMINLAVDLLLPVMVNSAVRTFSFFTILFDV